MTHVDLELPDDVAESLRQWAKDRGLTMEQYATEIVCRAAHRGWPDRFFEDVVGGWKGEPLERPPQGRLEKRDEL